MPIPQQLDDIEFDHPFRIHADGSIEDVYPEFYPPNVYHDDESDVHIDGECWEAFSTGYTGQFGYRGPVMHASEYIGGRLEADMLASPGVYVITTVETHGEDDEPAGWIVLKYDGEVRDVFADLGITTEYTAEIPSGYADPAPEGEIPLRIGVSTIEGDGTVGERYAHQVWVWGLWSGQELLFCGADLRSTAVAATHEDMARTACVFLAADAETLRHGISVEVPTYTQRQVGILELEETRLSVFGLGLE